VADLFLKLLSIHLGEQGNVAALNGQAVDAVHQGIGQLDLAIVHVGNQFHLIGNVSLGELTGGRNGKQQSENTHETERQPACERHGLEH
jgi:hypothetical protein